VHVHKGGKRSIIFRYLNWQFFFFIYLQQFMNVLGLDFQFLLHNKMKKNVNKQKIINNKNVE